MVDIARVRRKARAQKATSRPESPDRAQAPPEVVEGPPPAEAPKPQTLSETPPTAPPTALAEVPVPAPPVPESAASRPEAQESRLVPPESRPAAPVQILARLLKGAPALGRGPAQPTAETVKPTEALLVFSLAGEWYAVPLAQVRYIWSVRWVQSVEEKAATPMESVEVFTRVPGAPPEVRGVMSLRGRMVVVYDTHRRLGLPAPDTTRLWVLVLQDGDDRVGLSIERQSYVYRVSPEAILPPPFHLPPEKSEFLQGIVQHGDRIIGVLDLNRFLAL